MEKGHGILKLGHHRHRRDMVPGQYQGPDLTKMPGTQFQDEDRQTGPGFGTVPIALPFLPFWRTSFCPLHYLKNKFGVWLISCSGMSEPKPYYVLENDFMSFCSIIISYWRTLLVLLSVCPLICGQTVEDIHYWMALCTGGLCQGTQVCPPTRNSCRTHPFPGGQFLEERMSSMVEDRQNVLRGGGQTECPFRRIDRMSSEEDRQNGVQTKGQTGCPPRWRTDRMSCKAEDRMSSEEGDRQIVL